MLDVVERHDAHRIRSSLLMKKQKPMLDSLFYWTGVLASVCIGATVASHFVFGLAGLYSHTRRRQTITPQFQIDAVLAKTQKAQYDDFTNANCLGNLADYGIQQDDQADSVIKFMKDNYDKIHLAKVTDEMLIVPGLKTCYSKINGVEATNFFARNYHVRIHDNTTLEVGEVVLIYEHDTRRCRRAFAHDGVAPGEELKKYEVFKFTPAVSELLSEFTNSGQAPICWVVPPMMADE